jgi:hypothetical protein
MYYGPVQFSADVFKSISISQKYDPLMLKAATNHSIAANSRFFVEKCRVAEVKMGIILRK